MASMQLSSGELNTKMIERELVTAIAEDHTYKVTDDAKKRHIATAASYDEFRNFVACAEQTRVSRAEMQSLSKPEKGWQARTNLATGKAGNSKKGRPGSGRRAGSGREGPPTISSAFPSAPPKNPMAFERDWRRHCPTPELKLKFLALCGPDGIRKVFKTEIDVALLSQILKVLAETARARSEVVAFSAEAQLAFDVLHVLPTTGRFSLNIEFMAETDNANVRYCVDWLQKLEEAGVNEVNDVSEGSAEEAPTPFSSDDLAKIRTLFKVP